MGGNLMSDILYIIMQRYKKSVIYPMVFTLLTFKL